MSRVPAHQVTRLLESNTPAPRVACEAERRVFLHEMAHVATFWADEFYRPGAQQGPAWRREMLRLARECGESWAVPDTEGR